MIRNRELAAMLEMESQEFRLTKKVAFVPEIRADVHEDPRTVFYFVREAAFEDGYCRCRCGPCHHELVLLPEPDGPKGSVYLRCLECRRRCFKTNLSVLREKVVVAALNTWMKQWRPG